MSEITFVLIFTLVLILVAVYLGYRYIVMIETRLREVEQKNSMMALYMISKGVYDDFVKSRYNTSDFSSVHSAGTEADTTNSTKDNTNE